MATLFTGYKHGQLLACVKLESDDSIELQRQERQARRAAESLIRDMQTSGVNVEDGYILFQDVIYCVYSKNGFVDKIKGPKAKELKKLIRDSYDPNLNFTTLKGETNEH